MDGNSAGLWPERPEQLLWMIKSVVRRVKMNYQVKQIEEPDFGCEGRPEGEKVKDLVILEDRSGKEKVVKVEDAFLYEKNIQEGNLVTIEEDGLLQKVKE